MRLRRNIAILFIFLSLFYGMAFVQPRPAQADFLGDLNINFATICNLASAGNLNAILQEVLSTALSAGVKDLFDYISNHIGNLPGGNYLKQVIGNNVVPTSDSGSHTLITSSNAQEQFKNCAQQILIKKANQYALNFITQNVKDRTIRNFLDYQLVLANDVYVTHQISNMSSVEQFIIRSNINSILGRGSIDLTPVYTQAGLTATNYTAAVKSDPVKDNSLAIFDDPTRSTPQGQQYVAELQSQNVLSNAQTAANTEIATSGGTKNSYTTDANGNPQVRVPASYINTQVASRVNLVNQQDVQPQNLASVIAKYAMQYIANPHHPDTPAANLDHDVDIGLSGQSSQNQGTLLSQVTPVPTGGTGSGGSGGPTTGPGIDVCPDPNADPAGPGCSTNAGQSPLSAYKWYAYCQHYINDPLCTPDTFSDNVGWDICPGDIKIGGNGCATQANWENGTSPLPGYSSFSDYCGAYPDDPLCRQNPP